jgi:HK97 family phage prohead protease
MSKKDNQVIERKVGEKVTLTLGVDSALTKEVEDGILETVVTTGNLDRHGEKIVSMGVNTDTYMSNPVVLYGHDYQSLPIGKAISLEKRENSIIARFKLATEEYDFANTVSKLIKGGYLNAVSIGGIVKEWSKDFTEILKMDMVEFSVVPVPANAEATMTRRSLEEVSGKSFEEVKKEYQEFERETLVDKLDAMPYDEVSSAIKTLDGLLATLKESHKAKSSAGDSTPQEVKRILKVALVDSAKNLDKGIERTIRIIKLKKE